MSPASQDRPDQWTEAGQATLLLLGLLCALLLGVVVLFGFGRALAARGHAQRAADLAAISAAQVMDASSHGCTSRPSSTAFRIRAT